MTVASFSSPPAPTALGTAGRTIATSRDAVENADVSRGRVTMRDGGARATNACDHCGGRFGMVTHRWWGSKFCKRTCKDAYLRELALGRDRIGRWLGALRGVKAPGLSPLPASLSQASAQP